MFDTSGPVLDLPQILSPLMIPCLQYIPRRPPILLFLQYQRYLYQRERDLALRRIDELHEHYKKETERKDEADRKSTLTIWYSALQEAI